MTLEMPNDKIIAIDGTSGSGKSTLARGLGKRLGINVLETGSLYRATTLLCIENNVDVDDVDSIVSLAQNMNFVYDGYPQLNEVDVSERITKSDVAMNVSPVAKLAPVRAVITEWVRNWVIEHDGGVVEGRDITSVIFPDAKVKVFVDAPQEIRSLRRHKDVGDEGLSVDEINNINNLRDTMDSNREASPLIRVEGVYEIDSSKYSIEEMVDLVAKLYED